MLIVIFHIGLKAPECQTLHELVLQQKYFWNLNSISQFLETWISIGNTVGEISQLWNEISQKP